MKGLRKVLKVKDRELQSEREELNSLLIREKELKERIKRVNREIKKLKEQDIKTVHHLWLQNLSLKEKLNELKALEEELKELARALEIKREVVARKRGELNLTKELIKRKEIKEEKLREVINERFIYQTLYNGNSN